MGRYSNARLLGMTRGPHANTWLLLGHVLRNGPQAYVKCSPKTERALLGLIRGSYSNTWTLLVYFLPSVCLKLTTGYSPIVLGK